MLSSTQFLPTIQAGLSLLCEQIDSKMQITNISYQNSNCSFDRSSEPSSMEENIQYLVRYLLQEHSPLCALNIPVDILLAHINMLAPDLPLDTLTLIQDAISGTISDPNTALARIEELYAKQEQRTTPIPTYCWNIDFDTHIGKRKAAMGQTNQDHFFIGDDGRNALLMVVDGISVSNAGSGNMASNIAVQVVEHMWRQEKEKLREASSENIDKILVDMLYNANHSICEAAQNLSKNGIENDIPMGSTVLLAYAQGNFVTLLSLGDSRAYLITEDGPLILTGDHNLRGEKLRIGLQFEDFNSGNALMRYLGYFNEKYEIALPKPEIKKFRILPHERLLLCSDGYTDYAASTHADLCMFMHDAISDTPLSLACNNLILQANLGGGGDNITVVLAEFIAE